MFQEFPSGFDNGKPRLANQIGSEKFFHGKVREYQRGQVQRQHLPHPLKDISFRSFISYLSHLICLETKRKDISIGVVVRLASVRRKTASFRLFVINRHSFSFGVA